MMSKKLTEAAIREALTKRLREDPDSIVLEEVRLEGGTSRIDVASFGAEIVGFEIKSDFDNFDRMANQIHAFNRVFRKIHLVCGESHLEYALAILPGWWGINLALSSNGHVEIRQVREASTHNRQDPYSVASLLSKQKAIELLRRHRCPIRPRANLRAVWEAMADSVPPHEIEEAVIQSLKESMSQNMERSLFEAS